MQIYETIMQGNIDQAISWIKTNPEFLNMVTPFGTWLHVAASSGNIDMVRRLLDLGVDINARGGTLGGDALNYAASNGHIDVVKHLLSRGAEMDISEPEKNPLFSAIYGGHIEIVNLLLENGIDTHVRYTGNLMTNMDALAFAQERGQAKIVALLSKQA